ncbi:MAG: response regulator transcription factor [Ktedonobacteraceae bacterium]|nr:response regulator transcription factor [Ktedonobacteraceae bacterium]
MSQAGRSTILLIEADASLRRLIVLGLQQQGIRVIAAESLDTIPSVDAHSFNLLLLDLDRRTKSDSTMLEYVRSHPWLSRLPVVVLSWESLPSVLPENASLSGQATQSVTTTLMPTVSLLKPFDARVLYHTIHQLLHTHVRAKTRITQSAEAEVALPADAVFTPPRSAWPFATAAGLFVAVIGLMLHFAGVFLLLP